MVFTKYGENKRNLNFYRLIKARIFYELLRTSPINGSRKRASSKALLKDCLRKFNHQVPFYKEIEEQDPEKYF